MPAEEEQWRWLAEQLSGQADDHPVVLISHKPVAAGDEELASSPVYRFVPASPRRRLLAMLGDRRIPLILSGHVHQFRILGDHHRRHVWAPTTWAVLPEEVQATVGVKRCGVLHLSLDGHEVSHLEMVEPPGLRQLTLIRDLPDPYGR